MPASYKVGVKTKQHAHEWAYNALRFTFQEHAVEYARQLCLRWPEVQQTAVHGCDDTANAIYPVPSDRYPVERKPWPMESK